MLVSKPGSLLPIVSLCQVLETAVPQAIFKSKIVFDNRGVTLVTTDDNHKIQLDLVGKNHASSNHVEADEVPFSNDAVVDFFTRARAEGLGAGDSPPMA